MTNTSTPLIDSDVHCAVTRDDLMPYVSEYWRETLETTNQREPGSPAMTYPDWNTALRTRKGDLSLDRLRTDVLDDASYAILYCYYGVEAVTHPYRAEVTATAVNRWLQEHWLDQDSRLRASAVVTPQYPEMAVREIERVAEDPRFVQILLPARAPAGYGHQQYWPILRAAERHGLRVAITAGGGSGAPPTPVGWAGSFYEEYNLAPTLFQSHILSLVMSGIFAECPDLRVVLAESGWTWLPPLMWRMDQEWKAVHREVPWVKDAPSSYVRSFFKLTTQPFDSPESPAHLRALLDHIGSDDMLMYSSDYPHKYLHGNDELLSVPALESREKIRWRTAAALYGLDVRDGG